MFFYHFQHSRKIVLFTLMTMAVSGCGAPDFSSMKPTAVKPAAKVLLVNKPAGWSQSALSKLRQNDASLTSLAVSVQSIAAQDLQSQLNQVSTHDGVNLCIAVFPGKIPESALQTAKQHIQTDFEFVGTSSAQGSSKNVAQVVPNKQLPAYIAGWLAGSVNQKNAAHTIGVLTNGGQNLHKSTVEALFAGLYSTDPAAVLRLDTKFPPVPGKTSGNAVSSSLPNKSAVPAVNVEATPLSTNNEKRLKGHGVVFSGVTANGSAVVMQPGPPSPASVIHDLQGVVQKDWKSGVRTSNLNPAVVLSGKNLPAGTKQALTQLNPSNISPAYVAAAWKGIPKSIQNKWLAQLGL